jgi:hypothetical protein
MNRPRKLLLVIGVGSVLVSCSSDVTFFSEAFLNTVGGSSVPIAPGPDPGYVLVLGQNVTGQSVEFIVTAESEEIMATLDESGQVSNFSTRVLELETVNLLTDVGAPTLAIVFDNSPVEFAPVPPGALTQAQVQDAVDQLAQKEPESVVDRDFVRLVRVLRIGLGDNLDRPSDQDEGIVVRPAGSNPDENAGSIFASGAVKAFSYDSQSDLADFGNGDIILFLAVANSSVVGGVDVSTGWVDGELVTGQGDFVRNTFEILRDVEGPISPPPD